MLHNIKSDIFLEDIADSVIIGAGAAGLFAALQLSEKGRKVTVISEAELNGICASCWAQGGIAAAISKEDSSQEHSKDTLKAAAGTADIAVVEKLTTVAPKYIQILEKYGVKFKKDKKTGQFSLSREACHSKRRVLRAKAGDGFGRELMRALGEAVSIDKNIKFVANNTAITIVRQHSQSSGDICGILTFNKKNNSYHIQRAKTVILATGGIGALFSYTTNPNFAKGMGIAMAARAGAVIADMEFVQFHPTALAIGKDPAPLATEALRGDGALLVNQNSERFVNELAPRDEVSRAVFAQILKGNKVFLDCRDINVEEFPALMEACASVGINPKADLVPIHPAAHYHMGGIATDINGKTSISGLWACGEVASTGLHGANRLASNSLMEAVVMAGNVANDIDKEINHISTNLNISVPKYCQDIVKNHNKNNISKKGKLKELRDIMTKYVGIIRDEKGLKIAIRQLNKLSKDSEIENETLVAKIITHQALQRRESRGGHYRVDFPKTDKMQQHRSFTTLKEINIGTLYKNKERIYA